MVETERFILTPIQAGDLEAVFETMNSRKTADIISFLKWPITQEQAMSWCERSVKGLATGKGFVFLARDKKAASPVGTIGLFMTEDPEVGEVGYWITENWQGQGVASEILKSIIAFASQKGLSKLIATAAIENPISLRVLEKQGFKIVGTKELPTAKGKPLTCHLLELKIQ